MSHDGLGFSGNWVRQKPPGNQSESGQGKCLEGEFGYKRNMKCIERKKENKDT
jgi:hypothetical protein